MGGEVNIGWGQMKVLLRGERVKYIIVNLFLQFFKGKKMNHLKTAEIKSI